MSDIQVLIENIRRSVSFPESVTPQQMQGFARQYTESCAELNRRMMQCIQQIRSGNITEGIRLAELKPNLTEMYFSLDIPEREEWNDIVATLGFDVPPPFPVELSREVSEAYRKLSPLEPLLRWHRLHALNGSSLRERLAMIRSIAKADRENIYWTEDQEKFEKARIKELAREIPQAIETKNYQEIVSLHAELDESDWIVKPPPDYRWRLAGAVLQNDAQLLMERYNAFDHDEASKIYARMRQIADLEKMPMPQAVQQLIRPAVQWLNDTKRRSALQLEYNRAADELLDALQDDSEELPELERLYYVVGTSAMKAGTVCPEELKELYHAAVARRRASARRKTLLIALSIIVGSLMVVGLIAWVRHIFDRDYQRDRIQAVLVKFENELLTTKEPVPGLLTTLESHKNNTILPKFRDHFEGFVNRLKNRIDELEKQEREFLQYNDQAKKAIRPPEPDLSLNTQFIVEQVQKLMRTQQEELAFAELQNEYLTAIDKKFGEILNKITADHDAVKTNPNMSPTVKIEEFKQLEKRCRDCSELINQYHGVSEQRKIQCRNREMMIANDLKRIGDEVKLKLMMKELFAAVPDWQTYRSVLQRLTSDFPDFEHPNVSGAGDVFNEFDSVTETASLLQDFVTSYTKAAGDFSTLQQASATLKKKYGDASTQMTKTPDTIFQRGDIQPGDILDTLTKILPYTPRAFTTVETRLSELSRHQLIPLLVETSEGTKWYYLTTRPTKAGSYKYIISFSGDELNGDELSRGELSGDELSEDEHIYTIKNFNKAIILNRTPYAVANEAKRIIAEINDNAETVVDVISRLFIQEDSEPDIDPIIQCIMMDALIKDMSRIDPFFESNFSELKDMIEANDINQFSIWIDVTTNNTILRRTKAKKAIEKFLPKIQPAIDKTRQDRAMFIEKCMQLQPHFEWVGVLTETDGNRNCEVKPGTINVKSGDLYILRRSNQGVEPVKIGQVSSGEILLLNSKLSIPCAPVFFVQQ